MSAKLNRKKRIVYKNVTKLRLRVFLALWIERPLGVQKRVGLNPRISEFFLSIVGLNKKTEVRIYFFSSNHYPNLLLFTK